MAKRIAKRWLEKHATPEYRLTVYCDGADLTRLPGLIRSFRNGKAKLASVKLDGKLGLKIGFDHITIWGSSRIMLSSFDKWFRSRGHETTGIW